MRLGLRRFRQRNGLTQEAFAAAVGIRQGQLSEIEGGRGCLDATGQKIHRAAQRYEPDIRYETLMRDYGGE